MSDTYDVVVIGSGTGGYSCALRLAQLGKRVAVVERDERLGGTCLLRGCIPTKALLQSAAVMDSVNRSEEWGITASGEPDLPAMQAFERKIVDKLVNGLTGLVKQRKIDVIHGTGSLRPGPSVEVDGRTISATDVVDRDRLSAAPAPRRRGHRARHHVRRGALVPLDPVLGGDHRGRRDRARVREFLPLDGCRGHARRGAPPHRAARGRGLLQGDRPSLPQARHHDARRRDGEGGARRRRLGVGGVRSGRRESADRDRGHLSRSRSAVAP